VKKSDWEIMEILEAFDATGTTTLCQPPAAASQLVTDGTMAATQRPGVGRTTGGDPGVRRRVRVSPDRPSQQRLLVACASGDAWPGSLAVRDFRAWGA
jgi:hypothetical protein